MEKKPFIYLDMDIEETIVNDINRVASVTSCTPSQQNDFMTTSTPTHKNLLISSQPDHIIPSTEKMLLKTPSSIVTSQTDVLSHEETDTFNSNAITHGNGGEDVSSNITNQQPTFQVPSESGEQQQISSSPDFVKMEKGNYEG